MRYDGGERWAVVVVDSGTGIVRWLDDMRLRFAWAGERSASNGGNREMDGPVSQVGWRLRKTTATVAPAPGARKHDSPSRQGRSSVTPRDEGVVSSRRLPGPGRCPLRSVRGGQGTVVKGVDVAAAGGLATAGTTASVCR